MLPVPCRAEHEQVKAVFLGVGANGSARLVILDEFQARPGANDGGPLPGPLKVILDPVPQRRVLSLLVVGNLEADRLRQHGQGSDAAAVAAHDRRRYAQRLRGVTGTVPPHEHPVKWRGRRRSAAILRVSIHLEASSITGAGRVIEAAVISGLSCRVCGEPSSPPPL